MTGDDLLRTLAALANPHRLRIMATLAGGRVYVSQLARDLQISRPLLQMHLRRLESAGLVTTTVEVSDEGKALKFYEVTAFAIQLDPDTLAAAAKTLTTDEAKG